MPQFTVMSEAVSAAITSVRGERKATLTSAVRPIASSTAPAIGTDQRMRCATTSTAGMWSTSFRKSGSTPHSR